MLKSNFDNKDKERLKSINLVVNFDFFDCPDLLTMLFLVAIILNERKMTEGVNLWIK